VGGRAGGPLRQAFIHLITPIANSLITFLACIFILSKKSRNYGTFRADNKQMQAMVREENLFGVASSYLVLVEDIIWYRVKHRVSIL